MLTAVGGMGLGAMQALINKRYNFQVSLHFARGFTQVINPVVPPSTVLPSVTQTGGLGSRDPSLSCTLTHLHPVSTKLEHSGFITDAATVQVQRL